MAQNEDIKIQVMMIGGRRCGKTSVLSAMQANFQEVFSNTGLSIVASDMNTLNTLHAKQSEINNYFLNKDEGRQFVPDAAPTEDKSVYSFNVTFANKKGKVKIDFVDYPGEWLKDSSKNEDLQKEMEKSSVIIVAIDTPYMMEEKGKYNDNRNACSITIEMLKMAMDQNEDS